MKNVNIYTNEYQCHVNINQHEINIQRIYLSIS